MYINAPKDKGINLSPYLNPNERTISQITDDKKRIIMHQTYQKIAAHRPPSRTPEPEIYDWERIYKIENKRRTLDARKRFFELLEDPINDRKLHDQKIYIPKDCRDPKDPDKRFVDLHLPECQDYHEIV